MEAPSYHRVAVASTPKGTLPGHLSLQETALSATVDTLPL